MTQQILGLAGRKQSGKNTAFNWLLGIYCVKTAIVRGAIEIKPDGCLYISDIFGDEEHVGRFNIDRNTPAMIDFRERNIYPMLRNYSFADVLKKEVCMDLLGLTWDQCYGTDEDKMTATNLKWEDMPGVIIPGDENEYDQLFGSLDSYGQADHFIWRDYGGPMTAREVMQFVGTEIFRKMYGNVWAKGTIKRIKQHGSSMAVVTDCRFPNEVEAIQNAGGKVIRFTRNPFPDDSHESETALDKENFDWNKFDAVIDNSEMNISQQNEATYNVLRSWQWVDDIEIPIEELTT